MQTESLMNPDVLAFPEEMTVAEAARLLQEHRMTCAPVVDRAAKLMHQEHLHRVLVVDGRRLVGVLTAFDVVRAVALGWLR